MDSQELRRRLVNALVARGYLKDARVEIAFRTVPRHLFLPSMPLERVYADEAIPTHMRDGRAISSSSQPAIMAAMLEQLDVQPGDNVLEVGAGTGYNAALLSVLAGPGGRVTTVDIDQEFVAEARVRLDSAGFQQVKTVCGDGRDGYATSAPYDRIIVTAASWHVAPAWTEQLREGGRLVVPLTQPGAPPMQASTAFEKSVSGMGVISAIECGFMPLRDAG